MMSDEETKPVISDPIARNEERARRAAAVVTHYCDTDGDQMWLVAANLVADLMHLVQREGGDSQKMLRLAKWHFTSEINGDE